MWSGCQINNYRLEDQIGSGTFGLIISAINSINDKKYAIKIIGKQDNLNLKTLLFEYFTIFQNKLTLESLDLGEIKNLKNEEFVKQPYLKEISNQLKVHSHSNIVTIHTVFDSPHALFIVMDYYPNDLYNAIVMDNKLSSNGLLIKKVFIQLCSAIFHCHEEGIFHCDIKPENILLDSKFNIFLCDFGLSTNESFLSINAFIGSSYYMAPERIGFFKGTNVDLIPTSKGDIWSLGILLINLTCNRNPWLSANRLEDKNFKYYLEKSTLLKEILPISNIFNYLLLKILNVNPYYRIDIPEIMDEMLTIKSFTTEGPLSKVDRLDMDTYISILYCRDLNIDMDQDKNVSDLNHHNNNLFHDQMRLEDEEHMFNYFSHDESISTPGDSIMSIDHRNANQLNNWDIDYLNLEEFDVDINTATKQNQNDNDNQTNTNMDSNYNPKLNIARKFDIENKLTTNSQIEFFSEVYPSATTTLADNKFDIDDYLVTI
ncbi:hypothetical protein TBLA_0A01660 [Henningerozyma blattae CBS 6284]|uniref:non-specific serine/threonine protein kinase n=1 Tax=Henningerozyma blattae (strain ATCC 34711 / CBS 6284 / DSM 70876 / NBRC 10599 / NRRL Y-10934 / UCD 77-7) TaxID=1071380 RepID=I2GV14_HENB6|nr:hypothetical protein TBLA_0A01660 [Tetrapisispora blattae CBS 6284]CCH57966.1 hypothetical protein TBLA_0A01660 [Tetrapisispora blattae CBS 6284]